MKKFRLILALLAGLLLSQNILAQTILSGVVRDKGTNQPLVGANVYIVNANNRTLDGYIVQANGEYRLRIPEDSKGLSIVFSFIGYVTATVPYTGQTTINQSLAEDSFTVETINVTARRIERNSAGLSKREQIGASQKVSLETLESAPVTSVAEALQGAFGGVDIVTGGDPGSNSSITIRGTSSLNSSSAPLIVMDGVPFPVEIESNFNFATADAEDYSQLLNISPADLESVEVLKDAAATALYGSRGANGVLLITTKKGQKGRLQFTVSSKYEYKKEASTIPLLNASQYISMIQDAIWNSANDVGYNSTEGKEYLQLLFDRQEIGTFPEWKYYNEYNQDVDWIDYVTRPAFDLDNNISISGGGEKTNYLLSLGYLTNQGTTEGVSYDRFSATFNMGYRFSDKLDISTDFKFTRGERMANWSIDDLKTPRGEAMFKMPNMSPYTIDPKTGQMTGEYFTPYSNFQGSFGEGLRYNPVASVHEAYSKTIENYNRVAFNLHYKLLPGLDYYGTVSMEIKSNKPRSYVPQSVTGVTWVDGSFNKSSDKLSDQLYLYTENRLVYIKSFNDDHRLIASGVIHTTDQTKEEFGMSVSGNTSNWIVDPTSGGKIAEMKSSKSILRNMSILGNVTYTFKNRYTVNLGYRQEANSNVGDNNRWKGFMTAGGNWLFSEEKWFDNID
ncbi:SusC/RagA family TonB-linked outer membrane protein, partial [Alistipes sp. OttesenSCG-928-L06]|nr:SusC/RagA family TonB-linked outer membrane protein [Alistipes sp. OttesenSCG-928-L06]